VVVAIAAIVDKFHYQQDDDITTHLNNLLCVWSHIQLQVDGEWPIS